jgi:hypothetical protein
MICPLWDPIVFTVVEYIQLKLSKKKVLILFVKCVIYRLCINIKMFKQFFFNSAFMVTGTHSWISDDHERTVKEEFLNIFMFRHNL